MEQNKIKQILIYGHRGSSGQAPENTLAAIELAKQMGADGVEFDVKLTSDRKVVLLHDPSVDRTSNGTGLLRDMTFSRLRELDMGGWKAASYKGEKAPLLAEVFDHFGGELRLNIEITNYTTPRDDLVHEIYKEVQASGKKMELLFSSFYKRNLMRIRELIPQARTGQLVMPGLAGWAQRGACGDNALAAIHPYRTNLRSPFVSAAIRAGKDVNVWTVNTDEDVRAAVLAGVNGIITDHPDQVRKTLFDLRSDQ